MTRGHRKFLGAIAVIGWIALVAQFWLTLTNQANDLGVGERIVRYFSFFTILTNVLVAITATAIAFFPSTRIGRGFSSASTQTAVAVYIAIVGIIDNLLLRNGLDLGSLHGLLDIVFHIIVPIAFVINWIVFVPKAGLRWKDPLLWLGYPLVYIAYTLVHGAFVNWYPYWFADVSKLGYPVALRNTLFVLIAFFVVGAIFVAISKFVPGLRNHVSS